MKEKTTEYSTLLCHQVEKAVIDIWNTIGNDYLEAGETNSMPSADVVEVCCDAGRLEEAGYEEANTAKDILINEYGYTQFLKMVAAVMPYKTWGY